MDKIFAEWVGFEYTKTLYQILAYCLLPDYPLHRIFCFIGAGMNGKSKFLELLRKFIGEENVTATELDTLISSRFEVTRLYKKLICQMGETNFSELNKTSILKKLSGGDMIGFEYKNKTPFESVNYAKILISTNNLPTTSDKTIGFYRRWLIIDFPNQFSEKKEILSDIPEVEYENLAFKCIGILRELMQIKEFHNEGSIEDRMKKYEDHSDPLEKFIKEFTIDSPDGYVWKFEFEKKLNEWCKENRHRQISEVVIGKKMKEKGIQQQQKQSEWLIDGYKK
jgi:putative DNA primase/helicase